MGEGRAPISDATHVSRLAVPEVNFGWDFTVVPACGYAKPALCSVPGSLVFSLLHGFCCLHLCQSFLLEKNKYPADRSFLTCHFGDHQQILQRDDLH